MRRTSIVWLTFVACALTASGPAGAAAATAHPCRLISDDEVSRIIGAGARVEIGGSTCRVLLGAIKNDIGVITVNTDTPGRFADFRRKAFASTAQSATNIPGLGQSAFLTLRKDPSGSAPHSLFVYQRGHRLVITAFGILRKSIDPASGDEVYKHDPSPLTRAAAKRMAALITARI
jgi:hypothetical protein